MQIYSVGGHVRDLLLRRRGWVLPEGDCDWVVVGETPEAMVARGFLPVGGDFPVFLHPKTHEEYALARTERKTAPGYHGFVFHASPDVTLEEDLARRDLTVNAIALGPDGTLVDPYGGVRDLERGVLRHVSEAFREDPVRILRAARFAARFPAFSVAPETLELMRGMVDCGEADALVPERVLAEFTKGLATPAPCRMIDVLVACGLWQRLYPDVRLTAALRADLHRSRLWRLPTDLSLAVLASGRASTDGSGRAEREFLSKMRASAAAQELASLLGGGPNGGLARLHALATAEDAVELFRRIDALRRRERAETILRCREQALSAEGRGAATAAQLSRALDAWTGVDAGAVARTAPTPRDIPKLVLAARTAAVKAAWN